MPVCCVLRCDHTNRNSDCKFFRFPTDETKKQRWIAQAGGLRELKSDFNSSCRICSCHFLEGNTKNDPTLFVNKYVPDRADKKKRCHSSLSPGPASMIVQKIYSPNREGKSTLSPSTISISPAPSASPSESPRPCTSYFHSPARKSITPKPVIPADLIAPLLTETSPPISVPSTSKSQSQLIDLDSLLLPATTEAENYFLKNKVEKLEKQIEEQKLTTRFSFDEIKKTDKHVVMYTGLPNERIFMVLFNYLNSMEIEYFLKWNVFILPKIDQLFMTLMKLKLNLPNEDLAVRFDCSVTTVRNVFMTWIYVIHEGVYKTLMKKIPTREKNATCLPTSFANFTNCRIVLDCTEIYTEIPKQLDKQRATYSSYKHRNTLKVLVGVAPNGVVTYISNLYSGSTSDKVIVQQCGLLEQLHDGDLVIADKGFLVREDLPPGVSLNIPPFLVTPQFTPEQILRTRSIAKARIHVERAIQRIKMYRILNLIPHYLRDNSDVIVQVCAALTNFQYPLIKEVEPFF